LYPDSSELVTFVLAQVRREEETNTS